MLAEVSMVIDLEDDDDNSTSFQSWNPLFQWNGVSFYINRFSIDIYIDTIISMNLIFMKAKHIDNNISNYLEIIY